MNLSTFNQSLFNYLDCSPTPFHAVSEAVSFLQDAGFEALDEAKAWSLEEGKAYYLTRNDSSLLAFIYASADWHETGCRILGAHSDSPCLKLKPNPEIYFKNYLKLGVEVYGGVLLNPWFDRDLSLAGRVVVQLKGSEKEALLVNFEKAIANIPSLAIHLDREANKNRSVNMQKDIVPIVMQFDESEKNKPTLQSILLKQIETQYPDLSCESVCDFELSFYDIQKAAFVGLNDEFYASARLDNLLSCYVGLSALTQAFKQKKQNALLVLNDHEEVGSQTAQGAQGTFLSSVVERICGDQEKTARCLSQSLLISADNAHGIHPNFPDKHDANHGPLLNEGPVVKLNANQRYASNSLTSARFKQLADQVKEDTQSFVVRSDMACGSTIGPITAAELGVQTVDVGVPTFAMHSIRETAGTKDAFALFKITEQFFQEEKALL
jgi:aspartyl aminopeptidase